MPVAMSTQRGLFSLSIRLTVRAGSRYMKLCHTRQELARLPQGPKLVLATLPSLQAGMARELFVEWAHDPRNLILFTQQAEVLPYTASTAKSWSPIAESAYQCCSIDAAFDSMKTIATLETWT